MKRKLLFAFSLICLLCLCLSACATTTDPVKKEDLAARVAVDPDAEYGTVTEYLHAWDFPTFVSSALKPYEQVYLENLPDGVTVLAFSRTCAENFLADEFDSTDTTVRSSVTNALIRSLTVAYNSLRKDIPTDEAAIRAAMQAEGQTERETAALYLVSWGMPAFRTEKMVTVEYVFEDYYYKDLPDALSMARATAEYFLDNLSEQTDPADTEAVTDAYLRSYILSVGDRYSVYRTASEYEEYEDDRSGEYVGIGVTVQYSYEDGSMEITAVNDNGPAKEAGIRVGDYLYAVGGKLVSDLGYKPTTAEIRGEEGTEVTITVRRGEELLTFTVTRRALTQQTVSYSIDENKIGYVRITEFKVNTDTQFRKAIDALEAAGVRGIVFDLRSNPGGALTSVVGCLSYLVPKETPVATFDGYMTPMYSTDDHTLNVPAVVLCNGYTASAGELFTAALRDYSTPAFGLLDATVLGTQTYKKGIMQSTVTLRDKSSVTLTVARYNPPSDVNYDGIGITPDVILELSDDGNDNQLQKANEILLEKIKK